MLLSEQIPLVTETFTLNFAKAADIIEALDRMRTDRGNVDFDERTNTIILTDTKSNIGRLLGILEALDVETHKEELAVIKVLYADAKTLGAQISSIYGGSATGGSATAASARKSRSTRRT